MKKIILIRHSYAEAGGFTGSDFKRQLTNTGEQVASNQAMLLREKQIIPDLIITSSATRAQETTRLFKKEYNADIPVQQEPFLYEHYTTVDFFKLINSIPEKYNTVFVIAHNPTIAEMAVRFNPDAYFSFKPCSMAEFNCGAKWSHFEVAGAKLLNYYPS